MGIPLWFQTIHHLSIIIIIIIIITVVILDYSYDLGNSLIIFMMIFIYESSLERVGLVLVQRVDVEY